MRQVVGILSGGVEANQEVHVVMPCGDVLEALAELSIAGGGLDELQLASGGIEIVAQKGGIMAIARRVDADADFCWRKDSGLW